MKPKRPNVRILSPCEVLVYRMPRGAHAFDSAHLPRRPEIERLIDEITRAELRRRGKL
jgi:hypothetical protein